MWPTPATAPKNAFWSFFKIGNSQRSQCFHWVSCVAIPIRSPVLYPVELQVLDENVSVFQTFRHSRLRLPHRLYTVGCCQIDNDGCEPYKEFPLFAHPNGQQCRKICGKLPYFARWDDHEAVHGEFSTKPVSFLPGPGCRFYSTFVRTTPASTPRISTLPAG